MQGIHYQKREMSQASVRWRLESNLVTAVADLWEGDPTLYPPEPPVRAGLAHDGGCASDITAN